MRLHKPEHAVYTSMFADYDRLKPACLAALRARHALSSHDADAVYQAAWIALWQATRAGRPVRDAERFLLAAMDRRWRDELRRPHRRHELPLQHALHTPAPATDDPRLDDALETLTRAVQDERLRAILALSRLTGLTREQAAAAVGLPWDRRLQKRLDRASRRLRAS